MSYRVYTSPGMVLKKKNSGERDVVLYILTRDLGLVAASARSTRSSKSKLRGFTEEFTYGEFSLIKGRNGWKLTNVSDAENFFFSAPEYSRKTMAQISSVVMKMTQGESPHMEVFETVSKCFSFLTQARAEDVLSAEFLCVLRIMSELGYVHADNDVGVLLSNDSFDSDFLQKVQDNRIKIVAVINKAMKESQL